METVTLDVEFISLLIGTIIPLLVGALTKMRASSGVKAVVNALLVAITGVATTIVANDGEVVIEAAIATVLLTWVVSVATHYGLYKPAGATHALQRATKGFGLGSEQSGTHIDGPAAKSGNASSLPPTRHKRL